MKNHIEDTKCKALSFYYTKLSLYKHNREKNQRLATFQDVINIFFFKKRKRCLFTLNFINPGMFCAKFDLNSLSGDEKDFFGKNLVQVFSQYVYDLFMENGLSFM